MPVSNNIYYFSTRKHLEGSPTLVLIHGAGGNHLSWPHNLRRMAGYHVLAPDLPGHGKSSGIGEQSVEKYAAHIQRWMRELNIAHSIIVGHSMGGAIAQVLALHYPNRIKALVLLSTAASFKVDARVMNRLATPATYKSAVEQIVRLTNPPNMDQKIKKQVIDDLLKTRPGVLLSDFIACNHFDVVASVHQIKTPVCVITGEDDKMVNVKATQDLAEQIRNSEIHIIPQAGHMVMLERPQDVQNIMESFLEKI